MAKKPQRKRTWCLRGKKTFTMKKLFIFFLCLYGASASAQEPIAIGCDNEKLKSEPGKWLPQPKDEVDLSSSRPSAADVAGAKTVFNKMGKLFQEQYNPLGVDVYNYLTHFSAPGSLYSNSYIYTLSNFRYLCINGKRARNAEAVSSSVTINPVQTSGGVQFRKMDVYDQSGKLSSEVDNTGGFYSLTSTQCKGKRLPDFSNGYHSFQSGGDYYVWITYEGKMPYRYVSRKEFLEKQVVIGEAKLKEKNKYYSSKDWKELLDLLPENKEKLLEGKESELSRYEDLLESYRKDLRKDSAWLNKIAVVKQETVSDVYRYVFTTVDDPYMSAVPIMPNPDYYNRKLPKWAPQFMIIDISWSEDFIGKNIRKVIDNNIEYFKSILVNQ